MQHLRHAHSSVHVDLRQGADVAEEAFDGPDSRHSLPQR
jgi:hypothetical protein